MNSRWVACVYQTQWPKNVHTYLPNAHSSDSARNKSFVSIVFKLYCLVSTDFMISVYK